MGKKPPKALPELWLNNLHIQELESPHDYEEWYDVYCRDCEWSGDISPDLDALISGNRLKGKSAM